MKRLLYILAAFVLLSNSSCKKFLEESSQDEVKPGSVQDLVSLMSGEGYPYSSNLSLVLNFLSDDIQCYGGQGQLTYTTVVRKIKSPFSWSKSMFEDLLLAGGLSSTTQVNSWQVLYKQIAGCNVILGYLDKVSGDELTKQNLRGQALAMRAYYYFILVNMYAKPYNDPSISPEQSLGVPLKLDMEVSDQFFTRNTVAEVYAQMEKDLLEGAVLMKNNPVNTGIFKMSELAAYTMLSRVYLYEENWDKTLEYTNKALAIKSNLTQLSTFVAVGGYYAWNNLYMDKSYPTSSYNRIYDQTRSKEIIWEYQPLNGPEYEVFISSITPSFSATLSPPYAPSKELLDLYDSRPASDNEVYLADLRSRLYLNSAVAGIAIVNGALVLNFKMYYGGKGGGGLRVAELYLNRAEANIRKALSGGGAAGISSALNDINTLRASRYDTRQAYVPINITDATALFNFYKDERRRELTFEGHRWFDLRRYGMPSISHFYEEDPGSGVTYKLEKGDSRYTLQIPQLVMMRNPSLVQNP